jgi:glycosyltransferase involved in cell wall biosynthesis
VRDLSPRRADRPSSHGSLRIGLIAPPLVPLPPPGYAGTERIVSTLALALQERGHAVTVFAAGDSTLACPVVPVVPRALWPLGQRGDLRESFQASLAAAWERREEFDILHSHVDTAGFSAARRSSVPVVTTLHGRLDVGETPRLLDEYGDIPLIAISDSQRRWHPGAHWVATIHHGLDFTQTPLSKQPGDYLLLIGRVTREKGIAEAVELATRTGHRLVVAAKVHEPSEQALFDQVLRPAIAAGVVDWRGEVGTRQRDQLMAGALATLMLGAWPEPFGLVAIESMATGTPVIARRAGAYTETIDHGYNGFLVDDLDEAVLALQRVGRLDRRAVSAYARGRFSVERMAAQYEQAFYTVLEERAVATRRTAPAPRRLEPVALRLTPDDVAIAG